MKKINCLEEERGEKENSKNKLFHSHHWTVITKWKRGGRRVAVGLFPAHIEQARSHKGARKLPRLRAANYNH